VQNPLTSLAAAVEATQDVLALQQGPTVLVAHSFGGMILSEAGIASNVSAVVYVAARAPDAGEDYAALVSRFPAPPASAGIVWSGDDGRLSAEAFLRDFAGALLANSICPFLFPCLNKNKSTVLYVENARFWNRVFPLKLFCSLQDRPLTDQCFRYSR